MTRDDKIALGIAVPSLTIMGFAFFDLARMARKRGKGNGLGGAAGK